MKMKKILPILLTLCLSLSGMAMADTELTPESSSGTMRLSLTIEAGYILVIPSEVAISAGATRTDFPVEVIYYRLPMDSTLRVTFDSEGALTSENGASIPYRLLNGSFAVQGLTFTQVEQKTLTVSIAQSDWDAATAGSYSDLVTFTATIQ